MKLIKNIHDKKIIDQTNIKKNRALMAEREFKTFKFLLSEFYGFNFSSEKYKILDLGCGDKYLLDIFINNKFDYTGLDINDVDFTVDKLDIDDESFDFVVSLAVIEHMKDPSLFLSEVNRVLKKDGFFYLTTPNWNYSANTFYDDSTHVKPYTPKSLEHILNAFNFKYIQTFPGLRCKPKWFYLGKYRFLKGRYLFPFKNDQSILPNFLKGKCTSIICISKK